MPKRTVFCFFADSHTGSPVGVMGKPYVGKNGTLELTETQKVINEVVDTHIEKVNSLRRKGDRLIVAHLGDATEGKHHGSSETTSNLQSEHEGMHVAWMHNNRKKLNYNAKTDLTIYISGTEAHNGLQNENEHRIGKELGALPFISPGDDQDGGWYAWPRMVWDVNGVLFDLAHHPGVSAGRKVWNKANGLYNYLAGLYFQSLETGRKLPRYWIRADRHVYTKAEYTGKHGTLTGIILPALQAKTEYVYKVASDAVPTLGAFWCVIEPDGTSYHDFTLLEYQQDKVITL